MLSKNLETAINEQIQHEFYSAYFYLSMSAWAASRNMPGAAKWLGENPSGGVLAGTPCRHGRARRSKMV